uniref:Uncharacterized protein n=1 Tax=Brassica oleracea TaxID=3712 RepID=A0A3P6EUS5_BRAOL|nr:unnamed protein product [Brassica oleracea]
MLTMQILLISCNTFFFFLANKISCNTSIGVMSCEGSCYVLIMSSLHQLECPAVEIDTLACFVMHTFSSHEIPLTPGQPTKEPTLIPVVIGLLDSSGKDITLSSVYHDGTQQTISSSSTILRVTKVTQYIKKLIFNRVITNMLCSLPSSSERNPKAFGSRNVGPCNHMSRRTGPWLRGSDTWTSCTSTSECMCTPQCPRSCLHNTHPPAFAPHASLPLHRAENKYKECGSSS